MNKITLHELTYLIGGLAVAYFGTALITFAIGCLCSWLGPVIRRWLGH